MPIRIRNWKGVSNTYRYMQPSRGGNQPHLTYYAFYLRDPAAIIGFGLMCVIPFFWVIEDTYKDWRRSINMSLDKTVPYSGYNVRESQVGDWSEQRYGDGTDVGAVYELHFNDGSVQRVQDYPREFEEYSKFISQKNQQYEEEAEKARQLQKTYRENRRNEWLRLQQQQQQQQESA